MAYKKLNEIVSVLERPTPPNEVSFLPRGVKAKQGSQTEGFATAIPYIDSTYVENTLDEAAGKFGWESDIKQVAGVMCQGVCIYATEHPEGKWRWDVGLEKEQEEHGSKAEVTAGLKRAARQWGVGRDLKDYPKLRLPCQIWTTQQGKPVFIKWSREPRAAVMAAIANGNQGGGSEDEQVAGKAAEKAAGPPTPAGEKPPDLRPQTTGAVEGEQADDVTPAQARRMCYDYAIQEIEMDPKEANNWIINWEKTTGKTLESYRAIYAELQAIKKLNQPPD